MAESGYSEQRAAVGTFAALVLLAFISSGCATPHRMRLAAGDTDRSTSLSADRQIARFLFEAGTRWDQVCVVWLAQEGSFADEGEANRARIVAEREFSKFFDNAVSLYLRAEWTDDLIKSMHTLTVLVKNTEDFLGPANANPPLEVPLIDGLANGTETVSPDPSREALARIRAFWGEMSSKIRSPRLTTTWPSETIAKLAGMHDEYSRTYPGVLMAFLEGHASAGEMSRLVQPLIRMTETAREIMP